MSSFATVVQKAFFGFGMYAYIVVTRSRTISFQTLGVSFFRFSAIDFAFKHSMIDGLQVFGILKAFWSAVADEATEAVSSPDGGLKGLMGLGDFGEIKLYVDILCSNVGNWQELPAGESIWKEKNIKIKTR